MYGINMYKEEMKQLKVKKLMARHHITEHMLKLPAVIRLPADYLIRRINLLVEERKRIPQTFVR